MNAKRRFPAGVVAAIRDGQILGLRAGTEPHRFIGIWAVVVEGRVFVRSWSLKPRSWRGGGKQFAYPVHGRQMRIFCWGVAGCSARSHILPASLHYLEDVAVCLPLTCIPQILRA